MEVVDHLAEERSKADFDVEAMKIVWAGSPQALEVSDRISKLVASDPVFQKDNRPMLSRKDLFKNTLRKAAYAWKRIIEPRLSGIPSSQVFSSISIIAEEEAATLRFFVDEAAFTDLHWWWPGGLGKVSTHAVVYAHLITDGQDHGVHGFIVQLRSLEDHSPLPGITIGDIGMKFGNGAYNSMDNGVLRFDHVHIPRDQMLMRVSQVTREGKYMQSNIPRQLVYGTMVYVRQTIVADASCALSRAICIATRYSAVRRQFGSQNGGPETQVIDYKTQQSRLFPLLASAYAFRFVGEWLKWLYMDVTQKLQANDFSTLPEAHACTAGLKSLTTSATASRSNQGWVECMSLACTPQVLPSEHARRERGCEAKSHIAYVSNGLPELFVVYIPACTYEGANIVLLLQVARFLMKTVSQLRFGMKPVGTTSYMGRVEHLMQCRYDVQRAEDWAKPRAVLEAFEARAVRMSVACAQNLSKFANSEEGFAELSADLVEVAAAHCQLIVVSSQWRENRLDAYEEGIGHRHYRASLTAVLEAFEARAVRMSVACAQNLSKFANSEEGFTELSADLVEVAAAHCQLSVVSRFIEKLQQVIPEKGIKQQLEMLCNVYALFLLHKYQGDFLSTGCITAKLASLANDQLRSLYSQVCPNSFP
ncbi:hypothetical protein TEA_020865 [Camellia sinensis var. sinensis]|uniref:Acyl-coenzyme A oxidase n=1 Tax=Camellia sinensis var. sinensis TaxID=542762 RepID=A0A4S4DYF2_CAMSN|nr:hypothetical protein TEA_020865 [Camellia sinensis var. sinensis]